MADQGWYPDPIAERWWDGSRWTELTRNKGEQVGDGPVAVDNLSNPASWKADPVTERFWDGQRWTAETRSKAKKQDVVDPAKVPANVAGPQMAVPPPRPAQAVPITKPISRAPRSLESNRYGIIAVISAGVTVLAVAVIVVVNVFFGEGATTSTAGQNSTSLEVPVGAQRHEPAGGFLDPVSEGDIQLSVASCGGLLAKIDSTQCLETSIGGDTHALVMTDDGSFVSVSIYRLTTTDSTIRATRLLTSIISSSSELNTQAAINAYVLNLETSNVFALLVEQRSGDDVVATLEFIGPDVTDNLTTLAVFDGSGMNLAADSNRVFISIDRQDSQNSSSLVSTVYPTRDGWFVVEEVLDQTALDLLLNGRQVVLFQSDFNGFNPPQSTTTTEPRVTTSTTTPRTPGLIDGSLLNCDGTWISIVSSQPFETVQSGLRNHPGASAVKNVDACPSLNPYFNDGAYQGDPIYVVFYGPFSDRFTAQDYCLSLGKTTFSQCYIAPLTNDEADRSTRYGPSD